MLRRIILWKLGSVERRLGVSVDYLRHLARVSVGAFLKFAKIMPMAGYRKALPADAVNVARVVASRSADCGTCLQIALNVARQEGVPVEVLRAVLDRRPESLGAGLADVYRFSDAVLAHDDANAEPLRAAVRARYGERGVVEIALALASSLVFPTVKRTLGYATACANVRLSLA